MGILIAAPSLEASASAGRRVVQARWLEERIFVDGRADELTWRRAERNSGFVQSYPFDGATPADPTSVRVATDPNALYVLVEASDEEPGGVRAMLTQRDQDAPSDWIELWLNPQNDGQTGYRFALSAAGVQQDARASRSGELLDTHWNAVWQSAVTRTERGWVAEFRIPFSELRYDGQARTWGFQVIRRQARTNEVSSLNPVPKAAARPLLHLAELRGVWPAVDRRAIALRPYALVGLGTGRGGWQPEHRAGGDLRFNPSPDSTLHLTALPDFGQVEQDPSQLNLTAYEIQQTERRQFFLDGAENFVLELGFPNSGNEQLYYSRRIGQTPSVALPSAAQAATIPATRILGAAKWLGRTHDGTSYSVLSAVSGGVTAHYDLDGHSVEEAVLRPATFSVARVRRELQGGVGQIGGVATWVQRVGRPLPSNPRVDTAATAASDLDLRFGDWGLKGLLLGSSLWGTAQAIDAVQRSSVNNLNRAGASYTQYDPQARRLSGFGLGMQGGKYDGSPLRAYWGGQIRSPRLNTNDLGFMLAADQIKGELGAIYRFDRPTDWYQLAQVQVGGWAEENWGAELTSAGYWSQFTLNLRHNWAAWVGADRRAAALDSRLLRGGPSFLKPGLTGGWLGLETDARQPLQIKLAGNGQLGDERSLRLGRVALTATVRPIPSLTVSLGPVVEAQRSKLQYVKTDASRSQPAYILGDLSNEVYSLTLRATWTLALGLTLDVYMAPFLTAGRYAGFYEVTRPKAETLGERRRSTETDADPSYEFAQLRSNVVLRWDYAPGATFYSVWSRAQQQDTRGDGILNLGADLLQLWRHEPSDVFLLKISHYLRL